jgi:hypothetical protein
MKPSTARITKTSQNREDEAFSFSSATSFADKDEISSKNLVFTIGSIVLEQGRGFEGGDRWAITVSIDGRPNEIITLGCNEKRDNELRTAKAHLEKHGPIRNVRLKKSGNTYYLETVAKSKS